MTGQLIRGHWATDCGIGQRRIRVLCYVPNVVGYARVIILLLTLLSHSRGAYRFAWWLSVVQFLLDYVDGATARALNQVSAFGAFLDVLIDNASRGVLWICSLDAPFSVFPVLLEMLAFVCTHRGGGSEWKTKYYTSSPWFVKIVFKDGFRSPAGVLTIAGLMGFPLWLYSRKFLPTFWYSHVYIGVFLLAGRLLAAAVEGWTILFHICGLIDEDVAHQGAY